MEDAGGRRAEEKIADSIYRFNYAETEKGIYLTRDGSIDFVDSATGKIRLVWKTPEPDMGLAISPDGRYLLFSQVDASPDISQACRGGAKRRARVSFPQGIVNRRVLLEWRLVG